MKCWAGWSANWNQAVSPSPPAFSLSQHQGAFPMSQFSASGIQSIGVSASASVDSSNEYSGLISFRIDQLDLLEVQGTLKNLLQHHGSKASILQRSAFFIFQLSHPYLTTGKTIALTRWTFVGKVMSFLFNMLSKLVIAFLPRSKRLLISCVQSPSAVFLESKKIKSDTVSFPTPPSICHEVMGVDAMILVFWMLSFKPAFSLSSLTFIKRRFKSSSLSAVWVVSCAYMRLLIFLLAILIPACDSSQAGKMLLTRVYFANFLLPTEVYGFHSDCFLDWIFQFFGSTDMWIFLHRISGSFFAFFHILRTI